MKIRPSIRKICEKCRLINRRGKIKKLFQPKT